MLFSSVCSSIAALKLSQKVSHSNRLPLNGWMFIFGRLTLIRAVAGLTKLVLSWKELTGSLCLFVFKVSMILNLQSEIVSCIESASSVSFSSSSSVTARAIPESMFAISSALLVSRSSSAKS